MRLNLSLLEPLFRERLLRSAAPLGITEAEDGIVLKAEKSDKVQIIKEGNTVTVYYAAPYEFFYGVKTYLSSPESEKIDISCSFGELGVMLDCSRNAVRSLEGVKRFLDKLALMGYNQLQLYTEDTYEIEGEPYFGYQRGRYTKDELRELDAYARDYGIELVPCIQTLAHLNQIFRWNRFRDINDINAVLLIGDERTYEFIDRMFASLSETYTSRKLHIGLDEAHYMCRGKYLDINGYREASEVMCEHINRVVEIAKKYGFEPMMWADMFFRLANNGTYYVGKDAPPISEEIINLVPEGLRLVYWDYYQDNQEAYENMMERCNAFKNEVVFAGGAWTWMGFAPANRFSDVATNHAFNACKVKGIKNVFITMWGDDGAECSHFATLSTLSYASDYAYGVEDHESSFKALTGMSKEAFLSLEEVNRIRGGAPSANNISKVALYNDVFLGLFDGYMDEGDKERFSAAAAKIGEAKQSAGELSYIFETLEALAKALEYKAPLGVKTRKLYQTGDKKGLKKLANSDYVIAIRRIKEFYEAFKKQWYAENKGYGFEIQSVRIGGLIKRLEDCRKILLDYAKGRVERIEELEAKILEPVARKEMPPLSDIRFNSHNKTASTGLFYF